VEAIEAAVELRVAEYRLDELLSLSVELDAAVGVQDAAHERVQAAVPARSRRSAAAGVRRDQHLDPVGDDGRRATLLKAACRALPGDRY
jgi:hypothetical protein